MDELRPDHILQVGMGFLASKTVLSAVEMGLFTELANHSQSLETLQGGSASIAARPEISSIRSSR